jgi:hypothetical protein
MIIDARFVCLETATRTVSATHAQIRRRVAISWPSERFVDSVMVWQQKIDSVVYSRASVCSGLCSGLTFRFLVSNINEHRAQWWNNELSYASVNFGSHPTEVTPH